LRIHLFFLNKHRILGVGKEPKKKSPFFARFDAKMHFQLPFSTDRQENGQWRLGQIRRWSRKSSDKHSDEAELETPAFLLYTRAGVVPHLSWPTMGRFLRFEVVFFLRFKPFKKIKTKCRQKFT
jgi:hypothetical protein